MRAVWAVPIIASILILGTLGFSQDVYAPSFDEIAKLTASDAADSDFFGRAVSISVDTAIVGAHLDNDGGVDSGSAYVFGRDVGGADNWGQVAKLTALDDVGNLNFGRAVSISGDTAIVGAETNNGDIIIQTGAAYVFGRDVGGADNWGQVAKLTSSDGARFDLFGESVSISGDTVIVGATSDDDGGDSSGSAYVFVSSSIPVDIDIKPGSDPNCFNNDGNGVIPVAILGSNSFDVTLVDASTIQLEGMAVKVVGKANKLLSSIEDVNGDGFNDLVVKIEDTDGVFIQGTGTATLTGNLLDGTPIEGTDTICITQ